MIWAIVIIAAVAIGALTTALFGAFKKAPGETQEGSLTGPRSSFGDAIPIIIGTMQVDSPITIAATCFFGSKVLSGDPDTWDGQIIDPDIVNEPSYYPAQKAAIQYAGALDIVLSQRLFKNNAPLSTLRLRKIWYGDNLLWSGENWATPLTYSSDLLSADPNVLGPDNGLNYPGGVTDTGNAGPKAWYFGGYETQTTEGEATSLIGAYLFGVGYPGYNGTRYTKSQGLDRIRFYCGNGNEEMNPFFLSQAGPLLGSGDYPAYSNLARLVFSNFFFGLGPSIRPITAEITQSCPAAEIGDVSGLMQNGRDVNPVSFLYQLLTNTQLGGSPKVPAIDLADWSIARAAVAADGLGLSYRMQSRVKLSSVIDQVLQHIDGILYQEPTLGTLKIALNRDLLPNAIVPKFTAADMLEPPEIEKTTWEATVSQARLTFSMRGLAANGMTAQNVAVAKDPGLANDNQVDTLDDQIDTVFDPLVANLLAARKLAIANTPLLKITQKFKRSADAMGLRPLSAFDFDYPEWGIVKIRCRVVSIDFGNLEDNAVSIVAIQDRFVPAPIVAAPKPPLNIPVTLRRPDVTIANYRMEAAPYALARCGIQGDARRVLSTATMIGVYGAPKGELFDRFMMIAKRPYVGANFFSWQLRDTTDNIILETKLVPYTNSGTLDTTIASQTATTTGVVGGFTISGIDGNAIARMTSGLKRDGRNVVLIDSEYLLIETFTILSATSISVTNAHRMLWDSPNAPTGPNWIPVHNIGATVWFFDLRDQAGMAARLSAPIASNAFTLTAAFPSPSGPFDRPFAAGYGTARYQAILANADSLKNNLKVTASAVVLADRANNPYPTRRTAIDGPSNFPDLFVTLPSASSTLDIDLEPPSGYQPGLNPREGFDIFPFDSSLYITSYEEEIFPLLVGANYAPATWLKDNFKVWYRIPALPAFAALRNAPAQIGSGGLYRFTFPTGLNSRTVEVFIARSFDHPYGYAMLGQARAITMTLNRV